MAPRDERQGDAGPGPARGRRRITGYTDATGLPSRPSVRRLHQGGHDPRQLRHHGQHRSRAPSPGAGAQRLAALHRGSGVDRDAQFGTWTVATRASGIHPCGYVVQLEAYDARSWTVGASWRDDRLRGILPAQPGLAVKRRITCHLVLVRARRAGGVARYPPPPRRARTLGLLARRAPGRPGVGLGDLVRCFFCLSLWTAAPAALWLGSSWPGRAVTWLGLSAGAILIEVRALGGPSAPVVEERP